MPATVAAARAGEIALATAYEKKSAWLAQVVMKLPAWDAALEEVRGHIASVTGDTPEARRWFSTASKRFEEAGHPLDALRCKDLAVQRTHRTTHARRAASSTKS